MKGDPWTKMSVQLGRECGYYVNGMWRGRIAFMGRTAHIDEAMLFLSKVDDPTNFDFFPAAASPTDAIAIGLPGGEEVTSLEVIDDALIINGVYRVVGNPLVDGRMDRISS